MKTMFLIIILNLITKLFFKMARYLFILVFIFFGIIFSSAQDSIKSLTVVRVAEPPKIDGVLDDEVWKNVQVANEFVQFWPDNGAPAWQQSEVKFVYDNTAFYIGAMLYDTSPDSILTGLSERDNINNADYMGVYLDPVGNGMNGYGFFVTSSGIQVDMKVDTHNEDGSWDAVWMSETSLTDNGWIAEIKIPYTAIRFPNTDQQNWKINVWRNIMRHRQNTNWNFIDREKDGLLPQSGKLHGIEGIKPPVRLSLSPYISAYFEKNPENNEIGSAFNGGMDIKYGLNESFTLDMTLIPDFSQVQSDDKVLNLSPYETYYSEKRPFFNEGTELFNKLGLFHSRRIGGKPTRHGDIEDELNDGDSIVFNPAETRMLNATKLSGKTKGGLGIGVFNAMTREARAIVADSSGNERTIITQPFTNYNMLVLEQDLKNNSYINFSNTNLYRPDDKYSANVTGADLVLKNKTKNYLLQSRAFLSQKYSDTSNDELGHSVFLHAGKISGKFQGHVKFKLLSDKYDYNDMGFMERNNYTRTNIYLRYEKNKPFWIFNSFHTHVDLYRWSLYKPSVFTSSYAYYNLRVKTKSMYTAAFNTSIYPKGEKDYYEPRVEGRYVNSFKKQYHIGGWVESDSRKKITVFYNPGTRWWNDKGHYQYWQFASINFRASDKLSFAYDMGLTEVFNEIGWVKTNDDDDNIIYFGRRDVKTFSNVVSAKFIINKSSYFSIRLRHYNKDVKYNEQFYELETNGDLRNSIYSDNHNQSYNVFNVDMKYVWRFAPGSEFSIVWKNIIERDEDIILPNYLENLDKTINHPQTNSLSIKLIYYLDYLNFVRK